jgi:putative hydrolase of the HAD superfamily
MRNKKIVVFDIYKTLIDIEVDEDNLQVYDFLSRWFSYHGLVLEPEGVRAQYQCICREEMAANPESFPEIDISEVFGKMISGIPGSSGYEDNNLLPSTCKLFRILTAKSISVYPEVAGVLKTLNEKFRLGVISNSQRLFTLPELNKFGITPYFESIVFSSDAKVCKPNPTIFQRFLDSMSTRPEDAILVGDNLFDDVWGAKNVGMKAIWINRGHRDTVPSGFETPVPDAQIGSDSYNTLVDRILALA